MSQNLKQQIVDEIDSRIQRLDAHRNDQIVISGNQYDELNQVLSKVINTPLRDELDSLKKFICKL
ncbi:MAG TPA: hypothetical protein H9671_08195 [Firmicutes bacterium]|nr:hypothetical protein [Bacillota bacterium]